MLLTIVADYGTGDLAFAEVRQRLAGLLPEADVAAIPVPPFDTVSAGFCVAQLGFGEGPADRVIYANVAPRQDEDEPREDNAGERLVAARLASGVLVVGVASGASLSFLADEGVPLRAVNVPDAGSQFRSRDVFPAAVAGLVRGDESLLGEPVTVARAPERAVIYTDGYGNLKTSWYEAPAQVGTTVRVRIGDARVEAMVSDGVFTVPAGTVSFAPGSSGWPRGNQAPSGSEGEEKRACFELFARGGNAAELFGNPPSGTPVTVEIG
ncbi:S-adenosyl-l-methionine hydroxide adenosyltransferase family protein [Actinoplanes sp. TFC3]|uniref:SAM hydrolase/SAM-dependent halogenase family protein n=1 Tax=Actinoplanes sp. TFC3 TaxID=1710355 RepID=UPI0008337718|nr:SAM-dependent chlorinase/fluorinase [Actinoplanes sp. TFC3]